MSEPILEFESEEQAYKCLKEWQTRLFLDDWTIKLNINIAELNSRGNWGENDYLTENSSAIISLCVPDESMKDKPFTKFCAEKVLIHELLHLKFIIGEEVSDTTEGKFLNTHEHRLIEQMAKSLIMARYDLSFDWFKNF